jgi:hypothetical protein
MNLRGWKKKVQIPPLNEQEVFQILSMKELPPEDILN